MTKRKNKVMGWNHIIVEGFCMRLSSPKKDKCVYEIISMEPYKSKKIKNPLYDPKYKIPKKPSYCKDRICVGCLMNDCPHLAIGECPPKVHGYIDDMMRDMWDNKEDEEWNNG
jgi:hypothetical protein